MSVGQKEFWCYAGKRDPYTLNETFLSLFSILIIRRESGLICQQTNHISLKNHLLISHQVLWMTYFEIKEWIDGEFIHQWENLQVNLFLNQVDLWAWYFQ